MRRRDTILALLALGATAGPLAAGAQAQRAGPFRIGLLPDRTPAFREQIAAALRDLGWLEGRDYQFVLTGYQGGDQIEEAASRMVAASPDLILMIHVTPYAIAARRLTSSIPIVMLFSGYPVEEGLAHSLARPGGNVTGNTVYAGTGVWGKLAELLRDAKPSIKRIGVLWGYVEPAHTRKSIDPPHQEIRTAARSLGLAVNIVEVPSPDRTPAAIDAIDKERPDALLVAAGQRIGAQAKLVTQYAVAKRLPMIVDIRWQAAIEPYPLLVYGASVPDLFRQAVSYVVRILRDGARPSELPIQQPAKFELVVNLKTAKAIGLKLPQSILVRADEVIE